MLSFSCGACEFPHLDRIVSCQVATVHRGIISRYDVRGKGGTFLSDLACWPVRPWFLWHGGGGWKMTRITGQDSPD